MDSIYDIPDNFEKEGLSEMLCDLLYLTCKTGRTESAKEWEQFIRRVHAPVGAVKIAVIGKYFDTGDFVLADSYISVIEAVRHATYHYSRKPELTWINSVTYETNPEKLSELSQFDGIIVPGGFGSRGVEGIISAIKYARENKIPYFGLCYGMQLAVIEYARHVGGLKGATTREIDQNAEHLIINVMESQKEKIAKGTYGGTMRLGACEAYIASGTIAREAYGEEHVSERHRHRYEVNSDYIAMLEKAGLVFSGKSLDGSLCEIAELPKTVHPFFLGTQFHPEFKSRPLAPHKLFLAFVEACIKTTK